MHHSAAEGFSLFQQLPCPLLILAPDDSLRFANHAAEQLLGSSALEGKYLASFLNFGPLLPLLEKVRAGSTLVKEYDVVLDGPKCPAITVNLQISPYPNGGLLLLIDEKSLAGKLEQQLMRRESIRNASMMAAMLAHEVKNPLSGIKGAAQLLEESASPEDAKLARLIRQEVDRINALLQQIDFFSGQNPPLEENVNLHEILQYVVSLLRPSLSGNIAIHEQYDPSLPPVRGNRAALIQLFLNLIKNAAEALDGQTDGLLILSSAYQSGYRVKLPGSEQFYALPVAISIEDNGPGVPEALRANLFDPFVTSKPAGKGLGLAIVSKIAADHGGAVEMERKDGTTRFKVMLPF